MIPMISESTKIARQAFELADSGNDVEAIALYRRALSDADREHTDLCQIRQEFACILERSGDLHGAREQLELAVRDALWQTSNEDASSIVAVARYFLGELLLRLEEPAQALTTVQPSLGASRLEASLRTVEALAYWRMGSAAQARASAKRASECAMSDQARERVLDRLREIKGNG